MSTAIARDDLVEADRALLQGGDVKRLLLAGAPLLQLLSSAPLLLERTPRFLHGERACEYLTTCDVWDATADNVAREDYLLCVCAQQHPAAVAVRVWRRTLLLHTHLTTLEHHPAAHGGATTQDRAQLGHVWTFVRRALAHDRVASHDIPTGLAAWPLGVWERAERTLARVHQQAAAAWGCPGMGQGRWVVTPEVMDARDDGHLAALVTWPTVHVSANGHWCVQRAPSAPKPWEQDQGAKVVDLGPCLCDDDASVWSVFGRLWAPAHDGVLRAPQALTAARGIAAG